MARVQGAPLRLGLTGGIGCGKSTFAALLTERGAALIDADAIARAATAAQGSAMPAIAAAFGSTLITPDGALDRDAMRDLVYRDPGARARLEAIVHPLVGQAMERQADAAAAAGHALLVFDIPLLVEGGTHWRARLDAIAVVDCDPNLQIERVQARSGLGRAQIERIIAAQASRAARLAAADIVIFNGHATTPAQLAAQADELMAMRPRYHRSPSAKAPA